MKLINLITRTLDNTFYKNQISHFFEEVVDEIKVLKDHSLYKNNPNPLVEYLYEDEERNFLEARKQAIGKRYKKEYCPNDLFKYFNQSEKSNYIMLRVEIDKFLGIKDTFYNI